MRPTSARGGLTCARVQACVHARAPADARARTHTGACEGWCWTRLDGWTERVVDEGVDERGDAADGAARR